MADCFFPSVFFLCVSGLRSDDVPHATRGFLSQLGVYFLVLREIRQLVELRERGFLFCVFAWLFLRVHLAFLFARLLSIGENVFYNKSAVLVALIEKAARKKGTFFVASVMLVNLSPLYGLFVGIAASRIFVRYAVYNTERSNVRKSSYFVLTSSTARRITSASLIPSFLACACIHLCWSAVRTIMRWMPFIRTSSVEFTSPSMYYEIVKC
jgi:hypothetical protein